MRLMYLVLIILIAGSTGKVYSQRLSKQDTVLYLIFDSEKHHKYDHKAVDPVTIKEKWEWEYSYLTREAHLYDGYPLRFISFRKEQSDTIRLTELNQRYNTVSFNQLYQFISQNYRRGYVGYQAAEYFKNLKEIHLVEIDRKQQLAVITPVRLDVTIE